MNRYLSSLTNERGSALLVVVVLVPVLTLFCFLAANVSFQNQEVTTSDKCHRVALYNADGAIYGTAALISKIGKNDDTGTPRAPVQDGAGNAAPGIKYVTDAAAFAGLLSSNDSASTTEDVDFIKTNTAQDFGIEARVDMHKLPGGNLAGGGAEFGNSAEGIGSQIVVVVFQLQAQGNSSCANSTVQVNGDYWMIVSKGGQTKGI
jgi:hypothetical protein